MATARTSSWFSDAETSNSPRSAQHFRSYLKKNPRCSHLNHWFGWRGGREKEHTGRVCQHPAAFPQQWFHPSGMGNIAAACTDFFPCSCNQTWSEDPGHHANKEHCFWLGRRISRDQGSAWACHWQLYPWYKHFKMPIVILLPRLPFVVSTTWLVNCFKKS